MAAGDETGAGDETSGRHDRAEASAVDDRLVMDGTTPSSRGVDDYLEDRKFSVKSFEFYWFTCSPSSRPKTSPWVTSILPTAKALETSAKHKYDEAIFLAKTKAIFKSRERSMMLYNNNWLKHMFWT